MIFTLYHYVHCPFCIRVRMSLGYLKIAYKSEVVPYDDERTPIQLTGKKMLPILMHPGGALNESLDIIQLLDTSDALGVKSSLLSESHKELEKLLEEVSGPIHSLAMPYFVWTPEFTESSRLYFQAKKEVKRGPFRELVKNQDQFIQALKPFLRNIEADLIPFYRSSSFGIKDILLASHLWALYLVPEFQFSNPVHNWMQEVKKTCRFNYHQDFWS